jgi:membrane protein implicated in regulation of membrane protease activity
MLPLYIILGVAGGGLALASAFLGGHGHDGDVSHDLDHHGEVDHHGDGDSAMWLPFLSLRFWTYGLMVFGLCGWLLTIEGSNPAASILMISIITGIVMGTAVSNLMRILKRMQVDSNTNSADLLGMSALVTVPIRSKLDGKVRATIKGDLLDFLARSNDEREFESGEEVVIVAVENDRVRVIAKSELI